MRRDGKPSMLPKPLGQAIKGIVGKGRLQTYAIQISQQGTVIVYCMYGWTNGNTHKEAAQRTDGLIKAILEDMAHQPCCPFMVVT